MAAPVETDATVVGRAELRGGRYLLTLAAGRVAQLASPGQFAMLRAANGHDPYLRRALPFLRAAADAVSFLFEAGDPGLDQLAGRALGQAVSILGPLGRGFTLQAGTRQLLLATAGGSVAPLLALADQALAQEISVSLILDAGTAADLAPIIPREVELRVASAGEPQDGVWDLTAEMLAWADQVAVAGPVDALDRMARLVSPALRPGSVQAYVQAPMACGLGWCGSCLTEGRRGPRRVCVSGPVFDLRELVK